MIFIMRYIQETVVKDNGNDLHVRIVYLHFLNLFRWYSFKVNELINLHK